MPDKITAVVVTYNRLALLKECIESLRNQTSAVSDILVINNSSTDGTWQWLQQQKDITTITQENSGGSGGFYTGFREAVINHADWVWAMDDDTIPLTNALEKLLETQLHFDKDKVGFLCSKAVWTDGHPHLMNLPEPSAPDPLQGYADNAAILVKSCSFVSILLNSSIINRLGLPYKQFYIWYDDKEYTTRITKAGYHGIYCPGSIAVHKTPNNYRVDLYTDTANNLWKHAYGIRNEMFIVKRDKGILYFSLFAPAKVLYGVFNIFIKRKTGRKKFAEVLMKSAAQAFTFNPAIDKV